MVLIKKVLCSDFILGSLLNIISVCFLSVFSLLLYVVIARRYGAFILGIFSLVYSVYVIAAQIGSAGVQLSTLIHVARHSEDKEVCSEIISSAVMITVPLATLLSLVMFFCKDYLADLFKKPDVSIAISLSIAGLWCFVLNKLFLNIINGFNKMKAYAFFEAFRYFALLVGLCVVILMRIPGRKLTIILSFSEGLLLILMVSYSLRLFSFVSTARCFSWIKRHIIFGIKGLPGVVLPVINLRVDILMLGYFCSENIVGIYSFVAAIVQGIGYFPLVLRSNISPVFTKLSSQKKNENVEDIVRKGTRLLLPIMGLVGLAAIAAYPYVAEVILAKPEFVTGWLVFSILMTGVVIQGSYAPFSGLLVQSGRPGRQTLYILSIVITNILLNLYLIPQYGMLGAGIATSLSFVLSVVYLKIFSRYVLKISI